jgi:hypothetical protein
VIFFFSLGYRLLARRKDWIVIWLSPLLALLIGIAGVLGTNALITFVIPWTYTGLTVLILLIATFVLIIVLHPRFYLTSVPSLVFWVPLLTHFYTLFAGLISGVILDPPILLLISLVMIAIAFYLHHPTIQNILHLKVKPIQRIS